MALRWAWHNLDRPVGAGIAGRIGVTTVMANPQAAQLTHAFVRGSDGNLWLNRRVPIGWGVGQSGSADFLSQRPRPCGGDHR